MESESIDRRTENVNSIRVISTLIIYHRISPICVANDIDTRYCNYVSIHVPNTCLFPFALFRLSSTYQRDPEGEKQYPVYVYTKKYTKESIPLYRNLYADHPLLDRFDGMPFAT